MRWRGSWRSRRCSTALYVAPGNGGTSEVAENVALDPTDHAAVVGWAKANAIDFVVIGPDAPVVAGLGDDVRAAGIACFGPSKAAGQLEGSKGFTKALCDEMGIPTAAYRKFDAARAGPCLCAAEGHPDRHQGRWAGARQGRDRRDAHRGGRACDQGLLQRRVRRVRRVRRDRGFPRGRGGELLRALRRRTHAAARHRAGPQARLRRRHRSQHRRHGRLFAGAGDDRCADRADHARDHRADGARHEGARHALPGCAVCRD